MECDRIKVAVRLRPLLQKEIQNVKSQSWKVVQNGVVCCEPNSSGSPYYFDHVFDTDDSNFDIHEKVCEPVVQGAMDGFHGTIFAYGQSGSGKTYTISGNKMQSGILALAMHSVFRYIEQCPGRVFLLRISYMEIYNEKIIDLLTSDNEEKLLKLQEDTEHHISVLGLTEINIKDMQEVVDLVKCGDDKRKFAETKLNDRSSRSHSIFRIIIESRDANDSDSVDPVRVSHLNFVDLAGSEKAGENYKERFREGCAINKSLLALSNVIRVLSDGVAHAFVGFRDSKLTRILQNALGGNSKTLIICTISPSSVKESQSTLRFASQAKTIQNKAHVNEVLSDSAMLKKYEREIQKLQKMVSDIGVLDMQSEKEDLEKRLQAKERLESEQQVLIDQLRSKVVVSSTLKEQSFDNKRIQRRYSWAGAKAISAQDYTPQKRFAPLTKMKKIKSVTFVEDMNDFSFNGTLSNMSFSINEVENSTVFPLSQSSDLLTLNDSFFNSAATAMQHESTNMSLTSIHSTILLEDELRQTIEQNKIENKILEDELALAKLSIEELERNLNKESLIDTSQPFEMNRTAESWSSVLTQKNKELESLNEKIKSELDEKNKLYSTVHNTTQAQEKLVADLEKKIIDQNTTIEDLEREIHSKQEVQTISTVQEDLVDKLTVEITVLKCAVEDLNVSIAEKDQYIQRLQNGVTMQEDLLDKLTLKNKELESLNEKINSEVDEKNKLYSAVHNTTQAQEKLVADLEKKIIDQNTTIEDLEREIHSKQEVQTISTVREDLVDKLTVKNKELESLNEKIKSELDEKNKLYSAVHNTTQAQEKLVADLEKKIIDQNTTIEDLEREIHSKQEVQTISTVQEDLVDKLTVKNKELESLNEKIKSELDEKNKLYSAVHNTTQAQEKLVADLEKKIIDQNTTIEDLEREIHSKQEVQTISTVREDLVDKLTVKNKELESLNEKIKSELAEKNKLYSAVHNTTQAQEKLVADLEKKIIDQNTTIEDLEREIHSKQEVQTISTVREDLVDKLTVKNKELESLNEKIKSELDEKNKLYSDVHNTTQAQEKLVADLEKKIIDQNTTIEDLEREIHSKQEVQTISTVREDLVDKLTVKNKELESLNEKIKSELDEKNKLYSAVHNTTQAQEKLVADLEKKIIDQNTTIEDLEREIHSKQEVQTISTVREDLVDKLTVKNKELESLNEKIKSELDEKNKLYSAVHNTTQAQEKLVADLEKKIIDQNTTIEDLEREIHSKQEVQTISTVREDFVDKLTVKNKELESLNEKIKSELDEKNKLYSAVHNTTQAQENLVADLEKKIIDQNTTIEDLEREIHSKQEVQTISTVREDLVDKLTVEITVLKCAVEDLNVSIAEKDQYIQRLQNGVTMQEDLLDKLTLKNKELESLNEKIKSELDEKNKLYSAVHNTTQAQEKLVADLEKKIIDQNTTIEDLEREIHSKQEVQTISTVREDLVDKLTVEITVLKCAVEDLNVSIAEKDRYIQRLQNSVTMQEDLEKLTLTEEIIDRVLAIPDNWPHLKNEPLIHEKMAAVETRFKVTYVSRKKYILRYTEQMKLCEFKQKEYEKMVDVFEEKEKTWQAQYDEKDEIITKHVNEKKEMNIEIHRLKYQLKREDKKYHELVLAKEDTVEYKDGVIAGLKAQVRRMQQSCDTTISVECKMDEPAKEEVTPSGMQMTTSGVQVTTSGVQVTTSGVQVTTCGKSLCEADGVMPYASRSGAVDYYTVCVLDGQKKILEKNLDKLKSQLADLNEENLSLRDQLETATKMNKENMPLPGPEEEEQACAISRPKIKFIIPDQSEEKEKPCEVQ